MNLKEDIKSINIGFRCSQDWSTMDGDAKQRHCQNCQKMVYNFTSFGDREVLDFLKDRSNHATCGKFTAEQLSSINSSLVKEQLSYRKVWTLSLLLLGGGLSSCKTTKETSHYEEDLYASEMKILRYHINPDSLNTTLIKGKIIDNLGDALIGANISLLGTQRGTVSDVNGEFILELDDSEVTSDILEFTYTGYSTHMVELTDVGNNEVQITMNTYPGNWIGEIAIIKHPWYKRLWFRINNLF